MTEQQQFLVPQDVYLKAGVHIGTKFKTKYMEPFIYKTRPDGLSILNLQKIDERLKIAAKFLANYEAEDILVVSRRENGWKAIELFAKYTGAMAYPARYPPGIMTNPNLKNYIEPKVLLVVDAWPDRNAVADALKRGIPIVALVDTNGDPDVATIPIPGNDDAIRSIKLIAKIIADAVIEGRQGKDFLVRESEFVGEKEAA